MGIFETGAKVFVYVVEKIIHRTLLICIRSKCEPLCAALQTYYWFERKRKEEVCFSEKRVGLTWFGAPET